MKLRVYADTSVFGGCFDNEFLESSKQLVKEFTLGIKLLVVSDLTLKEIENAPLEVQDIMSTIPDKFKEYITLEDESKYLAKKYIAEKAISKKYTIDSQHIAIATANRVDVLVSWHFKHIVNLRRIHLYNATNLKYGYPIIEIRSPREIIDEK
ncbi:MAG: PIN domain protein [Spirochaetota bacterium]|nr:PIN domain protein [Spirochaetota bacterium]